MLCRTNWSWSLHRWEANASEILWIHQKEGNTDSRTIWQMPLLLPPSCSNSELCSAVKRSKQPENVVFSFRNYFTFNQTRPLQSQNVSPLPCSSVLFNLCKHTQSTHTTCVHMCVHVHVCMHTHTQGEGVFFGINFSQPPSAMSFLCSMLWDSKGQIPSFPVSPPLAGWHQLQRGGAHTNSCLWKVLSTSLVSKGCGSSCIPMPDLRPASGRAQSDRKFRLTDCHFHFLKRNLWEVA